jgi:hypothetical protein
MSRSPRKGTRPPAASTGGLSDDQVARWADLIADGRGDLPGDLSPGDRPRLLAAVRQRLRDRLVRLVARAIAERLHRQGGHGKKDSTDARTNV